MKKKRVRRPVCCDGCGADTTHPSRLCDGCRTPDPPASNDRDDRDDNSANDD